MDDDEQAGMHGVIGDLGVVMTTRGSGKVLPHAGNAGKVEVALGEGRSRW